MLYDGDTIEHEGLQFRVTFPHDDSGGLPWENEDGHGPVSDWRRGDNFTGHRSKAPGEMILCGDRHGYRTYDFAEAVRIAKRDGWDAEPYNTAETRGQRAAKAAMADFNRLRRFCDDQWGYVGVVVELLDKDGDPTGETDSVWGVESDASDYLEEVARELAEEIIHRLERPLKRA